MSDLLLKKDKVLVNDEVASFFFFFQITELIYFKQMTKLIWKRELNGINYLERVVSPQFNILETSFISIVVVVIFFLS